MFFKSKKVIGLDIGTSSLKLAEMNVSKGKASLVGFRIAPTPQNSVSGGEIVDPINLGHAINGLYQELGSSRKNIATGMWGMAVIVKRITMPHMDRKLLADQIRYEAEQYIPFEIGQVSLAYHILSSSGSPDTIDVLLVAAQNELVFQYKNAIEGSGLRCEVLDVSGFALANCFEMNYGKIPGQNIGLLNFGAAVTNFVVVSNGEVVFCRDVPVGGGNYTTEISKSMGISMQEAEMLKLNAMSSHEVPDEVMSIISSTNEAMAEEIRNGLDFLNATTNGLSLHRCFVTGGAMRTTGLMESVSRVTGLPLEILNPFARVQIGNSKKLPADYVEQISSFSAIAMGLGMRSVGDK